MSKSKDPLQIQSEGGIVEITLNRPKANAIDLLTSRKMGEIFSEFRDDPKLRVAILRAEGEKFFSAGWDLKAAADGDAVDGDYGIGGFGGLQELGNLNKPVICAVMEFVAEVDLRLPPDSFLLLKMQLCTSRNPFWNSCRCRKY